MFNLNHSSSFHLGSSSSTSGYIGLDSNDRPITAQYNRPVERVAVRDIELPEATCELCDMVCARTTLPLPHLLLNQSCCPCPICQTSQVFSLAAWTFHDSDSLTSNDQFEGYSLSFIYITVGLYHCNKRGERYHHRDLFFTYSW